MNIPEEIPMTPPIHIFTMTRIGSVKGSLRRIMTAFLRQDREMDWGSVPALGGLSEKEMGTLAPGGGASQIRGAPLVSAATFALIHLTGLREEDAG